MAQRKYTCPKCSKQFILTRPSGFEFSAKRLCYPCRLKEFDTRVKAMDLKPLSSRWAWIVGGIMVVGILILLITMALKAMSDYYG